MSRLLVSGMKIQMLAGRTFTSPSRLSFESAYSAPASTLKPFNEELLDSYSDSELIGYIETSPRIVTTRTEHAKLLSPNLIAKPVKGRVDDNPLDEVLAMERARKVGVNAPAFRRLASHHRKHYMVMEHIHGLTLEQLWRNISWWSTLHGSRDPIYNVSNLSHLRQQGRLHSGRTHCEHLDDEAGPILYASPSDFVGYLNWWLTECRPEFCKARTELMLEPEREHVLVHQDLAPRNMILEGDGKLWLIDWGHAGLYPAYMEHFGLEARTLATKWLGEGTWAAW